MSAFSAFSFTEKVKIFCGVISKRVTAIFNESILYDYSVLSLIKSSGDFELLIKDKHQLIFKLGSYKFVIRKKTSDSAVFNQVFLKKEYEPLVELLKASKVSTIIDAGANAGYTSLFFNQCFPAASLFAIEPSVSNREILEKNIQINNLEKVIKVLPYGLWSANKKLKGIDDFRDQKEWSYKVGASDSGDIDGRTLFSLMEENSLTGIDILKVDIEGAEKELFESPQIDVILSKTKSIAIETHREIGIDKLLLINQKLVTAGFDLFTIGECTFGLNKNII